MMINPGQAADCGFQLVRLIATRAQRKVKDFHNDHAYDDDKKYLIIFSIITVCSLYHNALDLTVMYL